MKRIKANSVNKCNSGYYIEYEVNGKEFWAQGEFYYDKKRGIYTHIHEGVRGGNYEIVFKPEN